MLDQWGRPILVKRKTVPHQLLCIVRTARAVSVRVGLESLEHYLRLALKSNQGKDICNCIQVNRLSHVSGYTVQQNQV